jgi:hypothetical protein
MKILIILIILSVISIFIPHKSKHYNLSWHARLLCSSTYIYLIGYLLYKLILTLKEIR